MNADGSDVEIKMECDGTDMFIVVNGMKIARRGHEGTPQAKAWISLEPGWRVLGGLNHSTIALEYTRPRVH
jgi:hypothetical protein